MCLATPTKIKKIEGDWAVIESPDHCHCHQATCDHDHHDHKVNISLLKNKEVKAGDYLLVHQDLAINKMPAQEAEKILSMIDQFSEPSK